MAGPSQSGKSELCAEIIRRRAEIFTPRVSRIIYCYAEPQPHLFSKMKRYAPHMEFVQGLEYNVPPGNTVPVLLFIDDLMGEAVTGRQVENLFCRESHHR